MKIITMLLQFYLFCHFGLFLNYFMRIKIAFNQCPDGTISLGVRQVSHFTLLLLLLM